MLTRSVIKPIILSRSNRDSARNYLRSLTLAAWLLVPAMAFAQNATTPGALEVYPTIKSLGVRLAYTGDANNNGSASIEWRPSNEATWRQGMTMTRVSLSAGKIWAGSVLFLNGATSYDVRVTVADGDGTGSPVSASATTRTVVIPSPLPSANAIWVSPTGNDSAQGTQASPLKSVALAMSRANAGDQVRLLPGIYYQEVNQATALRSGSANNYIHLISDTPRAAILDGSDPAFFNRTDWRDDGGGVYSLPYSGAAPYVASVGTGSSLYRLAAQTSLSNLQSAYLGVSQGFVTSGGRIYVRLEGNASPNGKQINIARYPIGLYLDASYWHVEGVAFQHFGHTNERASAIQISGADGIVIHNILAHTIGGRGVHAKDGSNNAYISGSTFSDTRIGGWPWDLSKGKVQERTAGVAIRAGRGHVVSGNVVDGTFDGLDCGDGAAGSNVATDLDFSDNEIRNCGDDGFELEETAGINVRAWGNKISGCYYSAISHAPVHNGPMYVLYNTISNIKTRGFKLSISSVGQIFIMHNTLSMGVSGTSSVWPTGPYSNMHFRNIILTGTGLPVANDETGESQNGNDFDSDLLYRSSSGTLFLWKSAAYSSVSALRTGTGFETRGIQGNPMFKNSAAGDFGLQSGSPGIDAAQRFPGINDSYTGGAPDIGSGEYGLASGGDTTPPSAPMTLTVM